MTDIRGLVQQQSRSIAGDSTYINLPALRDGPLVTADIIHQWVREGRVFQTHNPTLGTALVGSAAAAGGHVLTAPSIRFTVPVSTVVVPLRFKATFSAMAGTPNEMAIVASETDTYSSGGTSVTLTALSAFLSSGSGAPRSSAVTNLRSGSASALVEGTLVNPRVLDIQYFARADAVSEPKADWNAVLGRQGSFYYIQGPASILIYLSAVTTALSYEFVMEWAELDKNVLVNS